MVADNRDLALPFGFASPSEADFGALGRELLARARRRPHERRNRARLLVLPALVVYLLFAMGTGSVLWAMGFDLAAGPFLAVVNIAFLVMALLGRHYRQQPSWTMVTGGVGRRHTVLLLQAYLLKVLTAAFFVLPCRVMMLLADLFPRSPRVDGRVLTLATQLAAALDQSVVIEELAPILPRPLVPAVLEEAAVLLVQAGLATVRSVGSRHLLIPTDDRERLRAGLPASAVVTMSALRRPAA